MKLREITIIGDSKTILLLYGSLLKKKKTKLELKWLNRYTFTSIPHKLSKLSFKTPTEHS